MLILLPIPILVGTLWYGLRWIYVEIGILRGIERSIATKYYAILSAFLSATFFIYVLIAATFAAFYTVIEQRQPGQHFAGCEGGCRYSDFFYFSLITLATVGYGDITATSWQMRLVVSAEVLVGVIFIGALVGLLVAFGPLYAVESAQKLQELINRLTKWRHKE